MGTKQEITVCENCRTPGLCAEAVRQLAFEHGLEVVLDRTMGRVESSVHLHLRPVGGSGTLEYSSLPASKGGPSRVWFSWQAQRYKPWILEILPYFTERTCPGREA